MKAYVTKFALTRGILEIEAELCDRGMIKYRTEKYYLAQLFHKGEWFETMEEAIVDANARRDKKIASLTKSINRLNKLTF